MNLSFLWGFHTCLHPWCMHSVVHAHWHKHLVYIQCVQSPQKFTCKDNKSEESRNCSEINSCHVFFSGAGLWNNWAVIWIPRHDEHDSEPWRLAAKFLLSSGHPKNLSKSVSRGILLQRDEKSIRSLWGAIFGAHCICTLILGLRLSSLACI